MSIEIDCRACLGRINSVDEMEIHDDGTLIHQRCSAKAQEVLKGGLYTLDCKVCERKITFEERTAVDLQGEIIHEACFKRT